MEDKVLNAFGATIPYPIAVSAAGFVFLTGLLIAALVYLSKTTSLVLPLDPYIRPILAVLITLSFICCTLLMMSRIVPENEGAGLLLGGLLAAFSNVVTHYFNAAKKPTTTTPERKDKP